MADFATQTRLNGYKYHTPVFTKPESKLRDLYRETEALVFKSPRVQPHDCRESVMKDNTDKRLWETQLLSTGLTETYEAVVSMRAVEKQETGKRKPDKLLYDVCDKGTAPDQLNYPRGMTVSRDSDIIIADTMNHCVKRFNECGILKSTIGKQGTDPGEFNQPTGVAEMSNERIVVADRKNKRVQILTPNGTPKIIISIVGEEPFAVCCGREDMLIVSTFKGNIQIYDRDGYIKTKFSSISNTDDVTPSPSYVAVNDRNDVIVSDPKARTISSYTTAGRLIQRFEPICDMDGLSCSPTGICINPLNQILLADGLNHTVNLYTETGTLLHRLVGPNDGAGAVQQCAVGPQGHLVVVEYSSTGPHSIKVFRYRECECHKTRPGSSKKRPTTPTTTTQVS